MSSLRNLCVISLLAVMSLSTWAFEKTVNLTLASDNIEAFRIDCGAGFLKVTGEPGVEKISVIADISVDDVDMDKAEEFIKKNVILTLKKNGSKAVLESGFEQKNRKFWDHFNGKIDLTITMPELLFLDVDDGSGNIEINHVSGGLNLDDGSGNTILDFLKGEMELDDGSGNLTIMNCEGNMDIDDGSGNLIVEKCSGNLDLDDGSGNTTISDHKGNLNIEDGSGNITLTQIDGSAKIDDGSGNIIVDGLTGDLIIEESGSGGLSIKNIKGNVKK